MPSRLRRLSQPHAVYWFTALAFGLRMAASLHSASPRFFQTGYTFFFEIAQNIATGHGVSYAGTPTAFRVPLYPIFLAALTLGHTVAAPVLIAQSCIGAGTAFGAALLARQIYPGQPGARTAVLASAITALYPYYVVHDTALQETSLFTFLTLLTIIVLQRTACTGGFWPAALGGLLMGLDTMTRATIVPFAAFVTLWLIFRKRTVEALIYTLLLAATISPWIWRSYRLTGSPVLSTETGMQLWTGNNGFLFTHYPQESSDISKQEALDALTEQDKRELGQVADNEALTDRWFLHRGLRYIRTHPWITVRDDFRKLGAVFGPLPAARHSLGLNLVHAFSYGPVMLFGLWGMWQRRHHWRDDSLIYALFLSFALVTAIFFGDTSHRTYLDVYWIVFAAGVLAQWPLAVTTIKIPAPLKPPPPMEA